MPVWSSAQDLGGHVGQRPADGSRSFVTADPLRKSKIAHLKNTIIFYEKTPKTQCFMITSHKTQLILMMNFF